MAINPDIQKERDAATFSVEALTNIIDGDVNATKRRREIQSMALKELIFTEGEDYHFLSREDQYDRAVKKGAHLWKLASQMNLFDKVDFTSLHSIAFPSESAPNSIHWVMFVPMLQSQASDDQRNKWLPKALTGELTGTYAQTELGHGTNLRGLETTATYDPKTEEFVLHSPTLSSMKWWPGGLGKTSNSCIVMAQLVTQGQNYGMHPFLVQIRRSVDHEPMPGLTLGDIGPKYGFETIDNGFLRFDHFRIPRGNMLTKYSQVLADGTYVKNTSQKKPSYGAMTLTRTNIVERYGYRGLATAITIAVRYSAVRRQSELQPGNPEPQIMDYQTQQYKLFPYLAMSYGFMFVSKHLWVLQDDVMARSTPNNDVIAELHGLSAGLKAFCTKWMNTGIEQCRVACGGHGYSQASGLPKLYVASTAGCTVEGENTVMFLQAARYLVKCSHIIESGSAERLPDSVAYIAVADGGRSSLGPAFILSDVIACFEHRSRTVLQRVSRRIRELQRQGTPDWEARNETGVDLVRAAEAHCEAYTINVFAQAVSRIQDSAVGKVMHQLCQLLACYWVEKSTGDFLKDGYLTPADLTMIRGKTSSLLAEIRPNAVTLVDAFDFTDHYLCSVLGRYDGQVYENLYKWALKSPLNKTQVHESYHKYLKGMMSSRL